MIGKVLSILTDPMCLGTIFVVGLAPAVMPGASGVVVGTLAGAAMLFGWLTFARLDDRLAADLSDDSAMSRMKLPRRRASRSRKVISVTGGPLRRLAEQRHVTP